jgi:hypothetical protein
MYQLTIAPFTYPVTRKEADQRLFKEHGRAKYKGPLSADDMALVSLMTPEAQTEPTPPVGQRTVRNATPTLNDGVWSFGWSLADIPAPTSQDVNAERDRRMFSTFTFGGVTYDCDDASLSRITGAATLAGFAIGAGSSVGNLRWHGGSVDFAWIAADNSETPMDAQTSFAFGQAAAVNQSTHIFAGAAIKAMNPIPQDYATNESYWL